MGWFRRRSTGRHALGAAVTSIPSGPLTLPTPVSPPLAAEPVTPPLTAFQPELLSSVAQLMATGEAWASPAPAAEPPAVQVAAAPVETAEVVAAVRAEVPRQAPPPGSARSSLEAALAQLLPAQAEATPAPRVQLGFRDGTSTTLDPSSDQSLALEQIAQSLTRRD